MYFKTISATLGILLTIVGFGSQTLIASPAATQCEGILVVWGATVFELVCIGNCATSCSEHTGTTDNPQGVPHDVSYCKCRGSGGPGVPGCCTLYVWVDALGAVNAFAKGDCDTQDCPSDAGECHMTLTLPTGHPPYETQARCESGPQ